MILTQQLIDRIAEENATAGFARAVQPLSSAPAMLNELVTSPTVFVPVPSEQARPGDTGTFKTRNPTDVPFRILIAFKGPFANAEIEAARDGVKTALIGWTPDGGVYRPIEPRGSGAITADAAENYLLFACDFASHYVQETV